MSSKSKTSKFSEVDQARSHLREKMSFADASFDVVIISAVLHFAADEAQWEAMVREMFRVLRPGGLFFARLATDIGHETRVKPLGGRRYIMPDGDERFLVDEAYVMAATVRHSWIPSRRVWSGTPGR